MSQELTALLNELVNATCAADATPMEARYDATRHLIAHGEPGIAFENLCQNLCEFDVPLTRSQYQTIDRIGRSYGFSDTKWAFLEQLVT
jgi:hypothetical protein